MKRRNFLRSAVAGSVAFAGLTSTLGASASVVLNSEKFKLKYAPHFGMFKNSAGDDLIDQLKFAADHGFTAFEDNGMMGRDVAMQT